MAYLILDKQLMHSRYQAENAINKFPTSENSSICSIGRNEIKFRLQIIQMMRFALFK